MHIDGLWLSNNNTRKQKSKKLTKTEELELAIYNKQRKKSRLPEISNFNAEKIERSTFNMAKIPNYSKIAPIRDGLEWQKTAKSIKDTHKGAISTKSMMDPMYWKNEDPKIIEQTIAKSKRVAIAVNKSGYQYITDGMDPTTFGKK